MVGGGVLQKVRGKKVRGGDDALLHERGKEIKWKKVEGGDDASL